LFVLSVDCRYIALYPTVPYTFRYAVLSVRNTRSPRAQAKCVAGFCILAFFLLLTIYALYLYLCSPSIVLHVYILGSSLKQYTVMYMCNKSNGVAQWVALVMWR